MAVFVLFVKEWFQSVHPLHVLEIRIRNERNEIVP
jgi:hypothetical protein